MAKTTVSTRKIYDRMVDPVMISRFDNYFRMISDKHPERVMRLYESNQYVNIGFTQKAMHMFNNTELSAALLVRLSLIFSLTYGVDKESIRPYTHLVKESSYKYQMQVPKFWLRTRLVRDLGETWEWLMALMSFSANRFADMYSAFNMKDAIAHGNRLIMMHEGKIIYDVSGEEKKKLHVSDLLAKFEEVSGGEFANDRMMLS